ncbi:hypothetical protein EZV62_027735 [Acer yangbiense]|uniref:Rad21/Rec8-like protein N-terminal domain-containing protein n=1 Tax=Acer yangbiense TaxID=1000413 RepID=A0A5C7GUN9_9ROSI|nr:hypothetical protein EZV62_027735 [Acer yangbiense]
MFYSQFILAKKGPLGTIWIAAHLERKLRKNQVADTDIGVSVDSILFPDVPIALRLSSHLLLGVVRIYSRKVNYLFDDCSEALLKIKQAFRSTAVDLPPEESTAPYHSITLPETFDLDDFELPDNDIFQGNYVDHHISTREQITLQDSMDGVVYSTSQFGLDERFGDGDASQIGLDLDEELLMNKVTAAGHDGVSDGDPQGSDKPMTPWGQDDTNEQINDTPEAMAVDDSANQLERLDMNAGFAEYAEAPSTPGLVEQPNLSNAQEALVSDDHLESEDHNSNELVAAESTKSALSKSDLQHGDNSTIDSNHDTVQCNLPEENGYHEDSIKPMPLVSDFSEGALGALEGSERMESIHNVSMPSVESQGVRLDETAVSPSCSQVTSDADDPNHKTDPGTNVPVSEGYLMDDQASIETKIHNDQIVDNEGESGSGGAFVVDEGQARQEHEDPETLSNKVVQIEMLSFDTNGLKPCSSHLGQPDVSSPGHKNSVTPNFQSEEVEPCSFETSKRTGLSIEVQGEVCQVTNVMQSEENQISGPSPCGEIHADSSRLDGQLDNAISGDNQLQNLNDSMSSELPAPEKLLSVPEGFLDKPNDLLVESTPAKEVAESGGVGAGNKLTSGKKRSYTESTLTMESLNSSESFGVTRFKRTSESIPDDDDLLSSILVGRRSSVLKMKPTPPAPEVASRKRTRSAPQTSALKRKVLMDDSMVLHGDIIRQQLTSTEDIRRIRKKAPCTCPEILMIRIQFMEDEIFSEPTLTGMSAELMSLHCEPHDLSRIRVSENDESHGSSEVHINEGSARPNVSEGGMEGSSDAVVLRNDVEAQPADNTIQIESQQGGDHQLGSHYLDAHGHNAITDMNDLKTMQCESLAEITEMDIDRGHTDVDDAANCFTAQGMPTDEKTDSADVFLQIDASCLSPEQKVDAQPVEENASLLDVINSKGVDATQVADENADDVVAVETETKERDELPSQEGKVGISVENRADILIDCTASTENVNALEPASLENDVCNNLASANDDPSKLGVVNEDGDLVADFVSDGKDLVSNHMSGEEPAIDSVEYDADLKNAGLETGENSIFQEVDLQNVMDVEIAALDHRAVEDHGEYEGFGMGNDTDFLNVDDDEVAEDYDDGMEHTEDARLLENSGWSSRTRAVAKYLQTLFNREATNGRKVLAMDHLLAGKTRKEASRMFFETLVLKSKDYIHVEQARSLDNINIKASAKLIKSEF